MARNRSMFRLWAIVLLTVSIITVEGGNQNPSLRDSTPSDVDIRINEFQTCPDHMDLKNRFENISLRLDPDSMKLYVSAVLIMEEPVTENTRVKVILKRCLTSATASCEPFITADADNFCEHLEDESKIWYPVITKIENFPSKCPIPPGRYVLKDGLLEVLSVGDLASMKGRWLLELQFINNGNMILCVIGDGEIKKKKSARKHKKRRKNEEEE